MSAITQSTGDGALLLRPDEAARRLGLSSRALDRWRARGIGPSYVRLSARAIRYPLDALERWIAERHGRVGAAGRRRCTRDAS